jgi:hypothetical protein
MKVVMHYYGWGIKATPPLEWPPLPEPKKKPPPPKEEEEEEEDRAEKKDGEEEEVAEGEKRPRPKGKKASAQPAAGAKDDSGTSDAGYDSST